jgi:drug/metabolite transporter (DMT)-like permease
MRRRVDTGLLLLLTPILWGATFPATKIALRTLPVPAFMAWSRTLGFVTVLVLLPLIRRAGDHARFPLRRAVGPGLVLGGLMFVGYVLQTEGQARTTATNAGFITGIYVVFVPILASILFRHRVRRSSWIAVVISLLGLSLLSATDLDALAIHAGDLLVLAGAVGWAGHILAIGYFSPRLPAWLLSLAQLGAAATFHLAAAGPTGLRLADATSGEVLPLLVLTGILGTGVAFTIQVVAQRELTATRAVVLLAGEALFAAAFAAAWIGERLTAHQWVGAILVLGAMVYSERSARRSAAPRLDPAAVP